MRAEPFDAEAFRQAVTDLSSRREQAGDRIGKTLMQAIPQMSVAGRQALSHLGPPPPPKRPD
jgi:cytochrome c556